MDSDYWLTEPGYLGDSNEQSFDGFLSADRDPSLASARQRPFEPSFRPMWDNQQPSRESLSASTSAMDPGSPLQLAGLHLGDAEEPPSHSWYPSHSVPPVDRLAAPSLFVDNGTRAQEQPSAPLAPAASFLPPPPPPPPPAAAAPLAAPSRAPAVAPATVPTIVKVSIPSAVLPDFSSPVVFGDGELVEEVTEAHVLQSSDQEQVHPQLLPKGGRHVHKRKERASWGAAPAELASSLSVPLASRSIPRVRSVDSSPVPAYREPVIEAAVPALVRGGNVPYFAFVVHQQLRDHALDIPETDLQQQQQQQQHYPLPPLPRVASLPRLPHGTVARSPSNSRGYHQLPLTIDTTLQPRSPNHQNYHRQSASLPGSAAASPSSKASSALRVATACSNCKRSKTRCDHGRPCGRCVRLNRASTCVDSIHRRRGRKKNSELALNLAASRGADASLGLVAPGVVDGSVDDDLDVSDPDDQEGDDYVSGPSTPRMHVRGAVSASASCAASPVRETAPRNHLFEPSSG